MLQIIFPTIVFEKASKSVLNRLEQYNNFDVHKIYPDGSNLLHRLMRIKQHNSETDYELILDSLLSQNIDIKLVDHLGNSAVFYGI